MNDEELRLSAAREQALQDPLLAQVAVECFTEALYKKGGYLSAEAKAMLEGLRPTAHRDPQQMMAQLIAMQPCVTELMRRLFKAWDDAIECETRRIAGMLQ